VGVGKVFLIGAGPGSPDLITVRGLRSLRQADLVILDKLLPPTFLETFGLQVETLWLGDGAERKPQSEIDAMMVAAALNGRTVARLKCGDPFVFGRGAEEVDALRSHGIPWEVIPGLSAGLAAPSNAGMALTDRRHSRSFTAVTARQAGGALNPDTPQADSLVVFMGVAMLGEIAERLIVSGRPPDTPAAVIERATLPWERRVQGTLATIAELAKADGVQAPALLLVGPVAHKTEKRCTLLYTGLDPSNFRSLGDLIHWPALRVVPDSAVGRPLAGWDNGHHRRDRDRSGTSGIRCPCRLRALGGRFSGYSGDGGLRRR